MGNRVRMDIKILENKDTVQLSHLSATHTDHLHFWTIPRQTITKGER